MEGGTTSKLSDPDRNGAAPAQVAAGRYELFGEIGRGGMGLVHKGHDQRLGRDLAFKVLLPEHAGCAELVRRFIEEARVGGQLQHPGIAPVYDRGILADQRPFFTMRLVEGRTMRDLLSDRPGPPADLSRFLAIFQAVCQTMAYAHAHGVIHRDLKPSNIMVGGFGEVQVMDWGLAKVLERATRRPADGPCQETTHTIRAGPDAAASRAGSVLGTPAYMSPEQARGQTDRIDERTDVFALGAILCELLSGEPPYRTRSTNKVQAMAARADLADAFARLDVCGADTELRQLARHCLSAAPEDRPRQAGEVAGAVTAYLVSVQERLRRAELEAVEARTRTEEESKRRLLADQLASAAQGRADTERSRRRMAVGLMSALMMLSLVIFVAGAWLESQRREKAVRLAATLAKAAGLVGAAQDAPEDRSRLAAANEAVGQLTAIASDARDAPTRERITVLVKRIDAIDRERAVIEKLAEIRAGSLDDPDGTATESGYSDTFIEAGLRVYDQSPDQVGAAIRARSRALAEALTAALDDWASVLRDRYWPADEPSDRPPGSLPSVTRSGELIIPGLRGRFPGLDGPVFDTDQTQQEIRIETLRQLEQGLGLKQAEKLNAMAQAADPNPWRDELRRALGVVDQNQRHNALLQIARDKMTLDQSAYGLDLLARALFDQDEGAMAEEILRTGLGRHPRDQWLNYDLGIVLLSGGRRREALVYLTAARALRPETAHELAHALDSAWERPDAAIAVFEDLTRLRPRNPRHWLCLAKSLRARGRERDALDLEKRALLVAREAIRRNSDDANAHHTLGVLLNRFALLPGRKEGLAHLTIARRLRPKDASIAADLRDTLLHSMGLDHLNLPDLSLLERTTLPDDWPRDLTTAQLGEILTLRDIKQPLSDLDAVRASRKWVEDMAPLMKLMNLARAHSLPHISDSIPLGLSSGIVEMSNPGSRNLPWMPKTLEPSLGISRVLRRNSGHDIYSHRARSDAAALREQIRRHPEEAEPHAELAAVLMAEGQLEEAIAEFQRALDLEPPDTLLAAEVARRLANADRRALLAERLPMVLRGDDKPDGGEDWLSLAEFASERQLYAAAARLYEGAEAAEPELFDTWNGDRRYEAACAAALAGSGIARDQPAPTEADDARLRSRAREWLRADLAVWSEAVTGDEPSERTQAIESLRRWKSTPDLAALRGEEQLAKLPRSERDDWHALWSAVDALLPKTGDGHQDP
ncbi:protein kinase [Singulisphaera sp. Ch08]|uniref:Protein kinase n=1 Tax=Singulisphaera sp. Ch08 TaxID=3120278 RepID=A0AAU7CBP9_9BACT